LVTRLVKEFRSPTTLLEKVWTPPTMEAAKSAPGRAEEPREEGNDGAAVAVVGAGR
jgi:hypothetical protein